MSTYGKNPERVAAGLKATINRPNVSEEAKQRAMERLEEMGIDIEKPSRKSAQQSKAADPAPPAVNDTEAAELFASAPVDLPAPGSDRRVKQNILKSGQFAGQDGFQPGEGEEYGNEGRSRGPETGQPGEHRVLGGYKATLKNPNVSQKAKDHAHEVLEQNDAL